MRSRALLIATVAALVLSACAAPTQQYVAAKGMFFAVPKQWMPVPAAQLTSAEQGWTDDAGQVFQQSVQWQGAWSADGSNANAVFDATPPKAPIVFGFVRDLLAVERQGIGSSIPQALADVVIPASTLTAEELQTETLKRGGYRGIHQFATYPSDGAMQTVEVEIMLAPGKDRVHVLMARCSETCFNENSGRINAIFDSLTFREQRG